MKYGIELTIIGLEAPSEGDPMACKLEPLDVLFTSCLRSLSDCNEAAALALTNPDW